MSDYVKDVKENINFREAIKEQLGVYFKFKIAGSAEQNAQNGAMFMLFMGAFWVFMAGVCAFKYLYGMKS